MVNSAQIAAVGSQENAAGHEQAVTAVKGPSKLKGLKKSQVLKAANALLKHVAAQQANANDILEDDEVLYLLIALVKTPAGGKKDKPIPLSIPHPLYTFEGAEICLFVKDHKGEGHKEAKERLRQQKLAGVSKVIGLSKLRSKCESHEAKRQLCGSHDLFLADDRILPSLPKALGKVFFRKKKQPIPVRLAGKDWSGQIKAACCATHLFKPSGNSLTLRVARSSFTPEQCQENVLAALSQAMQHLPGGWKGVRALYLKSADSVALPIFQRIPSIGEAPAPPKEIDEGPPKKLKKSQ